MTNERIVLLFVKPFALRVRDIVHLTFLNRLVVPRQRQQTLVERAQLTLVIAHLRPVELTLVGPFLHTLHAPVVEDRRATVDTREPFHIHAALA